MTFLNRADAGRQLTNALRTRKGMDTIVVGVIRGGVPVAAEIARGLDAPLDICVVRKLVVAREGPMTIGAIAEGGATYFDPGSLARHDVTATELATALARESAEVVRLAHLLRERPQRDVRGRDIILVDDGVISGMTIRAAAFALTARGAHSIELATPVGATEVLDSLRPDFDRVTVLDSAPALVAVGARYHEFWPVADAEIVDVLEAAPLGLSGVAVAPV
jgi:putative phosphoribosyl transferase